MVAPLLRACRLGSCKLTLVRGQLCDDVARAPLIFVRLDPSISTLFDSANFILSFIVMGVNCEYLRVSIRCSTFEFTSTLLNIRIYVYLIDVNSNLHLILTLRYSFSDPITY